ncbi:MAG: DUF3788 domain-containing protein [Acidobacteriia bacterium]|nr:DUF3788 domain-containing protein [Terriglobia bacterium]
MTTPKPSKDKAKAAPVLNAFAGKTDAPDAQELTLALGPTRALWDKLVDSLQHKLAVVQEWGSSSPRAGWSLRLKRKERVILYLVPQHGSFQAALVLGDKAVKAARESKLPKRVAKTLAEARRYAEGTGIRMAVKEPADLAAIEKLALIKIEN